QGGDAGFTFAGLPAQPVRYRPEGQALHPDEWKPWEFDWEEMAAGYDNFLLRGEAAGGAMEIERRADLVLEAGTWRLYARRSKAVAVVGAETSAEATPQATRAREAEP
ncbi:MAG: hypothetical protein ABIV06_13935, partial [Thermoanaerobaculia bacterium]